MTAVLTEDSVQMMPANALDQMAGMYFWWDNASGAKRRFYYGRIVKILDGGYYLVRFKDCDELPMGLHEVVHIATMVADNWSFYVYVNELEDAIAAKEGDG